MSLDVWTAVDQYFEGAFTAPDPILDTVLSNSAAAGLPSINVSPAQGKLLLLLAQMQHASKILEIGTLGGYSTIFLARALPPGGRLITLEYEAKHVEVARANIASAGFADVVEVRHGRAIDLLPVIADEGIAPFDFIFMDADKQSNADYFVWALKLSRPGTVIICDNVVRSGEVVNADHEDDRVQGVRRFVDAVAAEPRVSATTVQTVGSKGYDGFTMMRVL